MCNIYAIAKNRWECVVLTPAVTSSLLCVISSFDVNNTIDDGMGLMKPA